MLLYPRILKCSAGGAGQESNGIFVFFSFKRSRRTIRFAVHVTFFNAAMKLVKGRSFRVYFTFAEKNIVPQGRGQDAKGNFFFFLLVLRGQDERLGSTVLVTFLML